MPLFAVETLEPERLRERCPGFVRAPELVPGAAAPSWPSLVVALGRPGTARAPPAGAGARSSAAARPGADARPGRSSSSDYGIRVAQPATTPTTRTSCTSTARCTRVALRAGRVEHRPVRRQLQLARPDLVPGQLPADRGAAEVPPLLRRRLPGRVPDRLGPGACRSAQVADDLSPPPDRASSCATPDGRRPVFGGDRADPDRSRTGATTCSSTSTSTATTAPASAPATRPAGPPWSPSSSTTSRTAARPPRHSLGRRQPDLRHSGACHLQMLPKRPTRNARRSEVAARPIVSNASLDDQE